MKPMNIVLSVLCATCLSGCFGLWDRHPGTQSGPLPDQDYWTDRTPRRDIARQWSEHQQSLSKMRLSEFWPIRWDAARP